MEPKVFISYSWSSPGHQARIRGWAEQLVNDGVDVVLDIWELREGDDKYAFMEKMVTDEAVTHVLVFSDAAYASKANARKAGVGTESQIISGEVYSKVKQSKFLPIVCEFDDSSEPFLPAFLKSRIWIDFSSPEAVNENWEKLIRIIYGKPADKKPVLGRPPTYITTNVSLPANPAGIKFSMLKQAILQGKRGLNIYRKDFLDACYTYADTLRVRARPDVEIMGERVLEDCGKLKVVRDQLVDWVLLESAISSSEEFNDELLSALEKLLDLKSRPYELNVWNDVWLEAHGVFVYETFLYIIAALIKTNSFDCLHTIFKNHYMMPESEVYGVERYKKFEAFYGQSESLQILAPEGKRLHAPAAELIKRQADRTDLPFSEIMQAELLTLMMAFIVKDGWWYPQTLHYVTRRGSFPLFIKAARSRDFKKLAKIAGVETGDELRAAVRLGQERLNVSKWHNFWLSDRSFSSDMNLDALDTLS